MDCFGTYFTHVQTCDNVRVQSATEWTASVHTLHMSKPVMTFVFKVLRNGLLRYILYTFPKRRTTPLLPQYYSVPQSTTLAMHYKYSFLLYKPKQSTSQPASQFGRPAGEHGTGRPAGPHGSGRGQNSEQIHGAIFFLFYLFDPFFILFSIVPPRNETLTTWDVLGGLHVLLEGMGHLVRLKEWNRRKNAKMYLCHQKNR